MTVEILYFDGCPNHAPAVERVKDVLKNMGLPDEVLEVQITDPAMAKSFRFVGSPSVRVNGLDVEPSARSADQVGFGCRIYNNGSHREGLPSVELIRQALLEDKQA